MEHQFGLIFITPNSSLINFLTLNYFILTTSEADTTPIAQCFGKTAYNLRIWPQPNRKEILGKDSLFIGSNQEMGIRNQESISRYVWNVDRGLVENEEPNGGKVNCRSDFEPNEIFPK